MAKDSLLTSFFSTTCLMTNRDTSAFSLSFKVGFTQPLKQKGICLLA